MHEDTGVSGFDYKDILGAENQLIGRYHVSSPPFRGVSSYSPLYKAEVFDASEEKKLLGTIEVYSNLTAIELPRPQGEAGPSSGTIDRIDIPHRQAAIENKELYTYAKIIAENPGHPIYVITGHMKKTHEHYAEQQKDTPGEPESPSGGMQADIVESGTRPDTTRGFSRNGTSVKKHAN